jgi:hypothetical protein
MKIKIIFVVFTIAIVLAALFIRSFWPLFMSTSIEPLSIQQIRSAMQRVGGDTVVEREATEAIQHFRSRNSSDTSSLMNCPSIDRLAALLEGEVLGIWPDGAAGIGVPAHVRIRRGDHANYQFIYIFAAGSSPAPNTPGLEFVSKSVFLRRTG